MNRPTCLLGSLCFLGACVATDVGNPQTDDQDQPPTEAEVRVVAYEEEVRNGLMLDDGVTLTHAWLAIERSRFESDCSDSGDSETEIDTESEMESEDEEEFEDIQQSVVVTDLLSGTSFPEPIRLGQPESTFCEFEFRVRPVGADRLPAGVPAEMSEHSIILRGERKDGTAFILRAGLEQDFELEGDIELTVDEANPLILGFAVNGWVTQRELGQLSGDLIEIDDSDDSIVYENFADAFETSPRLFVDDGDGTLEPNEAAEPIASPLAD